MNPLIEYEGGCYFGVSVLQARSLTKNGRAFLKRNASAEPWVEVFIFEGEWEEAWELAGCDIELLGWAEVPGLGGVSKQHIREYLVECCGIAPKRRGS